jgi:steroid delta-isomerase-like uncharacterized protein
VDADWLGTFVESYTAAWNSHEPERLFALMTDDIVYDDAGWPTRMRGPAEIRPFLESIWRALPDLRFEVLEGPYVVPGRPKAATHWRGTATFTGPLDPPGFAPTGERAVFEGVDLHEYRDGRLARLRIVFDLMDLTQQIGILPERGSRGERTLVAMQRAGKRLRR